MFKYIFSNIEKFIKEDEEYMTECYFSIGDFVKFTCNEVQNNYINNEWHTNYVILFQLFYRIGGLTKDIDIFKKIMEDIKKRIEENPYNLIFNTKPFVIEVEHRNIWYYTEAERIEYGRMGNSARLERHRERIRLQEETDEDEETDEKKKIINIGKIFKSDDCVICLIKPPNVLFCNCGHIPICVECEEVKSLMVCPVCKTENTIKKL